MDNDDPRLEHIEEQLAEVTRKIDRLSDDAKANTKFAIEAQQSLQNGQRTFEDLRTRMNDAEQQLRPNIGRIATAVFGLLAFVGTSVWALSLLFSERPTAAQLKDILEAHASAHHPITAKKLDDHDEKLQAHAKQLDHLELLTGAIREDTAEIKSDIKEIKRGRGR